MFNPSLTRKASGIPILSDAGIDVHAEMIATDYNPELIKTPQALDIEVMIEEYFGLNLHFENLSSTGYIWGCMVYNNVLIPVYRPEQGVAEDCPIEANTIIVDNQRLSDGAGNTCRSTIAHECGHWVYHKPIFELQLIDGQITNRACGFTSCQSRDVNSRSVRKSLRTEIDWIEHQAKYFESALLIPRTSLQTLCRDPSTLRQVESCVLCDVAEDRNRILADIVAKTFMVSHASARIRLTQLGLLYQRSAGEIRQRSLCWTSEPAVRKPAAPSWDEQLEAYEESRYKECFG